MFFILLFHSIYLKSANASLVCCHLNKRDGFDKAKKVKPKDKRSFPSAGDQSLHPGPPRSRQPLPGWPMEPFERAGPFLLPERVTPLPSTSACRVPGLRFASLREAITSAKLMPCPGHGISFAEAEASLLPEGGLKNGMGLGVTYHPKALLAL